MGGKDGDAGTHLRPAQRRPFQHGAEPESEGEGCMASAGDAGSGVACAKGRSALGQRRGMKFSLPHTGPPQYSHRTCDPIPPLLGHQIDLPVDQLAGFSCQSPGLQASYSLKHLRTALAQAPLQDHTHGAAKARPGRGGVLGGADWWWGICRHPEDMRRPRSMLCMALLVPAALLGRLPADSTTRCPLLPALTPGGHGCPRADEGDALAAAGRGPRAAGHAPSTRPAIPGRWRDVFSDTETGLCAPAQGGEGHCRAAHALCPSHLKPACPPRLPQALAQTAAECVLLFMVLPLEDTGPD